jgi:Nitroreductase
MREHEEIQEKLIEVANRRYATKKFDPDRKVDDDDWRTILEVGRLSPSSFGYEPWQFVELDNPQMRQDLKPIAWGAVNSINGADKLLLIFARKDDHLRQRLRKIHGPRRQAPRIRSQFQIITGL